MKHIISYKIFENISGDIKKEISYILSGLKERGYLTQVDIRYPNGPRKRISQILNLPSTFEVKIWKSQHTYKIKEIESDIINLANSVSDRYHISSILANSITDSKIIRSIKLIDELTEKCICYSIRFATNVDLVAHRDDNSDISPIKDLFQDFMDNGCVVSIKDLTDYVKISIDNLKPTRITDSGPPNQWHVFYEDEINEIITAINRYVDIYNVTFFDAKVMYRKEGWTEEKRGYMEKFIRSQDEFIEFIKQNEVVSVHLIFKK